MDMRPHDAMGGVLERAMGPRRANRLRGQLVGRLHLLPDFIIVGAARSGTSSLHERLSGHPNILPGPQDTHFFDTRRYTYGLSWYRVRFPDNRARRRLYAQGLHPVVTGEGSSGYLAHPHVAARIARAVPEVRLVVLLRDPVDRAIADWAFRRQAGRESRSFREAVEAELGPRGDDAGLRVPRQRRLDDPLVVRRGLYQPQLERWLTHFPRERLLVVQSERWFAEPSTVLDEVFGFLRIPRVALPPPVEGDVLDQRRREHARGLPTGSGDVGELEAEAASETDVLARLRQFYRPWNIALAETLEMPFDWERRRAGERGAASRA
jgi:hypothetical protein